MFQEFELTLETLARHSKCHRSKCAAIIVTPAGKIIGVGWNSPPQEKELDFCVKDFLPPTFKSDRTCCIHAEEQAIMDALRSRYQIEGATVVFGRMDEDGKIKPSGKLPWCTICSKLALDVGLRGFALLHEDGWKRYSTEEYNDLSFNSLVHRNHE